MSLAFSVGMPCWSEISWRTVPLADGVAVPARQVLHRHVSAHEARLHDLPQRIQLEVIVGGEHQLGVFQVELDRRLRALEVVALRHFLARLIQRVVHFLQIDVRGDVEGALRRHVRLMLTMRIDSFKHLPVRTMNVMSRDGGRPRVGISRCLLGDEVRYDGGHKRDALLLSTLGALVEWVPVCPEVEAGMGTPREAIDLVESDDGVPAGQARVRLLGVESRTIGLRR